MFNFNIFKLIFYCLVSKLFPIILFEIALFQFINICANTFLRLIANYFLLKSPIILKKINLCKTVFESIFHITVFDVFQSTLLVWENLGRWPFRWKKFILKILELGITSKKIFFNFSFHYVRYCNHLVTFFEKFSLQFALFKLSMKLARATSSSSSSVKFDHLESIEFS